MVWATRFEQIKLFLAIHYKSANGFTNELYLLEVVFDYGCLHFSAFQLVLGASSGNLQKPNMLPAILYRFAT